MANIAIIDDEASVLALVGTFLKTLGHEITSCESAESGMAAIREKRPQVALVDLNLGEASGLDITRQSRAECPETAIVIMTGEAGRETAEQAREIGAVGCLIKPFELATLQQVVDAALSGIPSSPAP